MRTERQDSNTDSELICFHMGNTNSSGHSRRRSRGMSQAEGRSETEAGGAEGSENDADVSGNENSESRHDTGFENEPEQADLASILAFLLRR